ncbi:MAG: hypothetical protein V4739_04735 [Pseudomonadota bacterium]
MAEAKFTIQAAEHIVKAMVESKVVAFIGPITAKEAVAGAKADALYLRTLFQELVNPAAREQ